MGRSRLSGVRQEALDQVEQRAEASKVNFREVEVLHLYKNDQRATYGRGGTILGRNTEGRDFGADDHTAVHQQLQRSQFQVLRNVKIKRNHHSPLSCTGQALARMQHPVLGIALQKGPRWADACPEDAQEPGRKTELGNCGRSWAILVWRKEDSGEPGLPSWRVWRAAVEESGQNCSEWFPKGK